MLQKNSFIYLGKSSSLILSSLLLLILSSCNPVKKNKVEILTQGALVPVEFWVDGGENKGEFLVGSDTKTFTLYLKNNNAFQIFDIKLDVDAFSSASMKFTTDADGKSKSPGFGGTCSDKLAAGATCSFKVEYTPSFSGELSQDFKLTYSNLVNRESDSAKITLLAGEAASLVFSNDIVNYDYGYMERTEPKKITKVLTVVNNGGLTARNMVFGVLYSHNSGAFSIKDNSCGTELKPGAQCSFTVDYIPMNYGPSAPDGVAEATYTANPRFDYIRDPEGGKGALTAYFTALSTTIEGRVISSGITQLEYSELTVGNYETKPVKIQNYGYKEAIVHNVEVYDASDNKVATCIKVAGQTELVCQDPSSVAVDGAPLPLSTLPLKIEDTTGCINKFVDLDYTRDSAGNLSNPNLFMLAGKTTDKPGDSCFLNITFWPSVVHTTNGNINDYKLRFKFDSTWKNAIVLYGYDNSFDFQFLFKTANWLSAAQLQVSEYRYGSNTSYTRESGTAANVYLYDLGRIALISNNAYKQGMKVTFKNIGYTDAQIQSVQDANSTPHTLTETTVDLNPYYLSTGHVGCGIVNAIGGSCDIRYDLAPMASSLSGSAAQAEENGYMFDVTNPYPDQYKKFIITYKDGALYNDDGSLRTPRSIEVWSRALLVRKGFLVFSSTSASQGTGLQTVGDTPLYHHIFIKNAGTGGIPVIEYINGNALEGTTEKSSGNYYLYQLEDRPDVDVNGDGFYDGVPGADKDCYDLFVQQDAPLPVVTPGTNASSILDAGQICSLTVRVKARGNDVYLPSQYNDTTPVEWQRFFDTDFQNTHELWEERKLFGSSEQVSFHYYDGDGVADSANGYYPDQAGYGNYYQIAGGTDGYYSIDGKTSFPARMVPILPLPSVSAIICRDDVVLPAYTIASDEWGTGLTAATIPETCMDYSNLKTAFPVSNWAQTANYVKSNNSGYDYIYHAGVFPAGSTYDLSFKLQRYGSVAATNLNYTYTGDTSVINWTNPWTNPLSKTYTKPITMSFTPSAAGTYTTDLVVTYKNGEALLTDINNLTFSDESVTLRVKVIAEAIAAGSDNIALSVQDYSVIYDANTSTVDDTALSGSAYPISLYQRVGDMAGNGVTFYGIRESVVYDKKIYTFTNNSGSDLTNFQFNIKTDVNGATFGPPPGSGMSIAKNNCLNITLAASASCTVEMHFLASKDEVAQAKVYGTVVYGMGGIAYQMKNFEMTFNAADPAILETSPKIATKIIKDANNLNIKSIPLNLGLYADSGHPVISDYPTHRFSKTNIKIVDISQEKASFLAQWNLYSGNASLPGSSWVTIYNTGGITVEANRACFYGDDEFDGAVAAEQKGFNINTSASCNLNFYIDLDDTYFAKELDTSKTYFKLRYYNNKRASTDDMIFHFTGFVEPNRSQMGNTDISNVAALNDGSLYLEWQAATTDVASWGSITGYRVYYSTTKSSLNDIFKASTYEVTTDQFIQLTGLVPGRYYYIKIVTQRLSPQGITYVSDIISPIKEVIVPPNGYFYNYDNKVLVSKSTSSSSGPDLKTKGAAVCGSDVVTLSKNGAIQNKTMKLIDSSIWNIIEQDTANSSYDTSSTPHWLNDAPVDISFIFANFDCAQTSGDDGGTNFYTKDCSDCSCNMLSIVKGGDGQFLPPGSTIYVDGGGMSAFFRCYIDQ